MSQKRKNEFLEVYKYVTFRQVPDSLFPELSEHISGLFTKYSEYKLIKQVKGRHIELVDISY